MEAILKDFEKNGICKDHTDKRFKSVLEFQDFIGKSTNGQITEKFLNMDRNMRGLFVWACGSCLDKDQFLSITKQNICDAIIYEEELRLNDAHDNRMKDIIEREKKMGVLEAENKIMKDTIDALKDRNTQALDTILSLRIKADKFDALKRILN